MSPPVSTPTLRDRLAFALFHDIYGAEIADDPGFPARVWAELTEQQRALYYRKADVVLRVLADAGVAVGEPA